MTIGTGTFLPNGRFALPRSYLYEFCVARYIDTLTYTLNQYTIHAVPPSSETATIILDIRFYPWSSNRWTLDHMVKEFYYQAVPLGVKVPLNYQLSYGFASGSGRPAILFEWFAGAPNFEDTPLPAQPSGYWLPNPL